MSITSAKLKALFEKKLTSLLEGEKSPLAQAARYSALGGGKRLRPLLLLSTLLAYSPSVERGLVPACALELIHTYSLIHDDLPCMDDDDLRRGKPTLHKVVPEWHALLTGDYLLSYAFDLLAHAPALDDGEKVALLSLFSRSIGAKGLLGGQVIDLQSENKKISWPLLKKMHEQKTAALFSLSLQAGALLARAPRSDVRTLKEIGRRAGLAYQLRDDLLDSTSLLGKQPRSDERNHKSTALSVLGEKRAKRVLSTLVSSLDPLLDSLSVKAPLLLKVLLEAGVFASNPPRNHREAALPPRFGVSQRG